MNIKPKTSDKKKHYRSSLKEIFSILFKNSKRIRILIPLELVLLILDGMIISQIPVIVKYIIDGIEKNPDIFIKEQLLFVILITVIVPITWYLIATTHHYLKEKISNNLMINIQLSLYMHLQTLSLDFYHSTYVGEITSRLTNDIYQSIKVTYYSFSRIIWLLALLIPSFFTMCQYDFIFFLIFLGFMLIFLVLSKLILPVIRGKEREAMNQWGIINARITESIYSVSLVKAFAKEKDMYKRVKIQVGQFLKKTLRAALVRITFSDFLSMFVSFFAPLFIIWIGVLLKLELGVIVAFFAYWTIIGNRLNRLIESLSQIFVALASFDRIMEFFNKTPLINDNPQAKPISITQGRIEFRDVDFQYPLNEDGMVLKNINFSIEAHRSYAIVGESGSGKTTVMNLILRFYDPIKGKILIDNQDVRQVQQTSIRREIGIVMQETILLNGTIKDNMLFVKQDATDEEIISALKKAEAWDFIKPMEQGIDSIIGEKGTRLSGGQRQRLALARIFLKDPKILLFDEATSSLDSRTEKQIQETMQKLLKNRTSIIITHRLSTIMDCNKILFLQKGKIVGMGTHKQLYSSCPAYRELCVKQNIYG